jgi:hypothetical protein
MCHLILLSLLITFDPCTLDVLGNPEEGIGGYRLFWGFEGTGQYTYSIDVGNLTSVEIPDSLFDPSRLYFFAVTCTDLAGNESVYSNEAIWPIQKIPKRKKWSPLLPPFQVIPLPFVQNNSKKHR